MADNKLEQQLDNNGAPTEQQVSEQKITATSQKDALGDSSLDKVSGGSWPFSSAASASYRVNGPTG